MPLYEGQDVECSYVPTIVRSPSIAEAACFLAMTYDQAGYDSFEVRLIIVWRAGYPRQSQVYRVLRKPHLVFLPDEGYSVQTVWKYEGYCVLSEDEI